MKLLLNNVRIWMYVCVLGATLTAGQQSALAAESYLDIRFDNIVRLDAGITSTLPPTGIFICGPGKVNATNYKRICFSVQEVTTDSRSTQFVNRCRDSVDSLIQLKQISPRSKAYLSFPMRVKKGGGVYDYGDGTAHIWSDDIFRCSLVISEENPR